MKLTLLGTGTPIIDPSRRGPSQVIETGSDLILVDCGSGAAHRLLEAGYGRPRLSRIALTHLHSDHVTGLPDLLWAGWVLRWWERPPVVSGPPGTRALVEGLLSAFGYDIRVRRQGEKLSLEALSPEVEEIDDAWSREGPDWRLTAFRVDHEPVDEAFGFRIDEESVSIVISGDTRPSENLERCATDTDLLVHEVYWARGSREERSRMSDPEAIARRLVVEGYHTSSEEVGKVAANANARHLVLTHLLFRGGGPADLETDARAAFGGRLTVGSDLQSFEV
jgi:ribonuclease Z